MSDTAPTLPPEGVSKPNPVLIMAGVIAALNVVLGGLAQADVIDDKWYGLFNLIIAAITVGYGVITRGQVAPWADVVAKRGQRNVVLAGPAATQTTGTPVVVNSAPGTPSNPGV